MELPDARTLSQDAQQALRERAVAAVQAGASITAVADQFAVSRQAVSAWWAA
ncbi:MAG: helix-turn-helix domain-containing protein [Gemmataceae bacterium]|nr:helix-turn-helix domain-containing protein [Gemmataceae bacterium]